LLSILGLYSSTVYNILWQCLASVDRSNSSLKSLSIHKCYRPDGGETIYSRLYVYRFPVITQQMIGRRVTSCHV